MRAILAALLLAAVTPLAAWAQPSDSDLILKPRWLSPEFSPQAFYPPRVQRLGQVGAAKILCEVGPTDRLTNCQVISETPTGWGFGEALLKLSPHLRIEHLDGDGRPVEGRKVEMKLKFNLR